MKLYVIRHGQTDWNVKEKCQGRTDIELNNTGIKQAQNAKEQLKKYKIDLIICSPLKRTRKTAEIINETINSEIIIDERIIERGYGNLEGKTDEEWKEIVGDNVSIVNYYNLNWNKQNIEPIQDICKRVWEVLDEIKEKYNDKNVLLVTHGGTCRAINAYFNGIGEDGHVQSAKIKKSVDARKKDDVHYSYSIDLKLKNENINRNKKSRKNRRSKTSL